MSAGANFFLKKTLGEDFFESLQKAELWKPGTRTVIDPEEIKIGLKIVPRTVMSLLIRELAPMQIGETKEIWLGIGESSDKDGMIRATKHERDVYSGDVLQDNKIVVDFKYRSIPGIGLVVMSAFELYDVEQLSKPAPGSPGYTDDFSKRVQARIDERLALHDLVDKVVDKKIAEKDAIQQLILAKLTEELEDKKRKVSDLTEIAKTSAPMSDPYFQGMANGMIVADSVVNDIHDPKFIEAPKKKGSPLKDFLDGRENKLKKNEFSIQLAKGETVDCPDCGHNIFNGSVFAGCVCLGDDRDKKIYLKKTEDGMKIRFGKGWDVENIEMLLEVLRRNHG